MALERDNMQRPNYSDFAIRVSAMLVLCCLFPGQAAADHPRCIACHGPDGMGYGNFSIPIIAGIPAVHIEEALYAYKDGARQCEHAPLMCQTVSEVSDHEITELAEYFGSQPRTTSEQEYDAAEASKGKQVHDRLCKGCHLPPDDPDVAEALGIPLHGQHSWYLRYALDSYLNGSRENLLPAMANKLSMLQDGDVDALINYYASF